MQTKTLTTNFQQECDKDCNTQLDRWISSNNTELEEVAMLTYEERKSYVAVCIIYMWNIYHRLTKFYHDNLNDACQSIPIILWI